jgi:hypothetical protein
MTTVARLRDALAQHFGAAEARTTLLRLREAGVLPAGTHGRLGSAEIAPHDAALAVLALISGEEPIAAPEAARLLGSYSLRAYFLPLVGPASANLVPAEDKIDFLTFMVGEIEFAIDPANRIVGLYVKPNRISTIDPDGIAEFERRPGDPPVLRDVEDARERLEFVPEVKRPIWDERGRPLAWGLSTIVHPKVIRGVASTFATQRRPATIRSGDGAA